MDECHNVINFGEIDTINVDDATVCKMVNTLHRIKYSLLFSRVLDMLKHDSVLMWLNTKYGKYWFFLCVISLTYLKQQRNRENE